MQKYLDAFQNYHQVLGNRLCHYPGIILVTIGTLGLLDYVTIFGLSSAVILLLATLIIDLITWPKIALPVFGMGIFLLVGSFAMTPQTCFVLLLLGMGIQIVSHRFIEKNHPAFTSHLIHAHLGPRWLILQMGHLIGFRLSRSNDQRLNTDISDAFRYLLAKAIPLAAKVIKFRMIREIKEIEKRQAKLSEDYEVTHSLPEPYSEKTKKKIHDRRSEIGEGVFAYTSGSTAEPKRILYTKERLKLFKKSSIHATIQSFAYLEVKNPSIFIFASLKKDDSFASLVVEQEERVPSFLSGLIEPSKYLNHPAIKAVIKVTGSHLARLLLLGISSPGVLYATNPSTLAVFFEDIEANWSTYRQTLIDFTEDKGLFSGLSFTSSWIRMLSHIGRGDFRDRIATFARRKEFAMIEDLCPDLRGYVCWDGGYVTGFLQKIYKYLPSHKFTHIPMFSMSTETMQTELFINQKNLYYLPISKRVLFEFQEENQNRNSPLLSPRQLREGMNYAMIVSDPWGLKRYQTGDIFQCVNKVFGLPDLRFVRRQGLTYSFTGEKLTGKHIEDALERLRRKHPNIEGLGMQFTLIPSQPQKANPHYILLGAYTSQSADHINRQMLEQDFETFMFEINHEFKEKRLSGRLGKTYCLFLDYDTVAAMFTRRDGKNDSRADRSWDSQFKLTPITRIRWQELSSHAT